MRSCTPDLYAITWYQKNPMKVWYLHRHKIYFSPLAQITTTGLYTLMTACITLEVSLHGCNLSSYFRTAAQVLSSQGEMITIPLSKVQGWWRKKEHGALRVGGWETGSRTGTLACLYYGAAVAMGTLTQRRQCRKHQHTVCQTARVRESCYHVLQVAGAWSYTQEAS